MDKARQELGSEAMLISSKKTGPESSRLGAYEVVFGVTGETSPRARAQSSAPSATVERAAPANPEGSDALARELADLRKQIENVRRSVSRQGYSPVSGTHKAPEFGELYEMLVEADFSDETAHELVQAVAARNAFADNRSISPDTLSRALREEVEQRFRVSSELDVPHGGQRITAFVGPSGAGKTTALVKLALRYGVATRTPSQIFSTDTLRVGGSEQLGAYARIMGVSFQAVSSTAALEQALEEIRGSKKLIFIDTPGYSPAEMEEAAELRSFLGRNPHVDVQLVLPATMRGSAISSALKRFSIFHPSKVFFTHLDEIETTGGIVDAAIRSALPISFLSTGQQIPEDLEGASKAVLTDKLFDRARAAVAFAA